MDQRPRPVKLRRANRGRRAIPARFLPGGPDDTIPDDSRGPRTRDWPRGMAMSDDLLIEHAHAIASQFLAPRAARADQATEPPVEQIRHLAEAGLLGLTTPPGYGGRGASPKVVRDCLAAVAAGCGVTAFVTFQHLVGCRHIAEGDNGPLKQRLLPELAGGRRLCSLAFSHLRRPGPPTR